MTQYFLPILAVAFGVIIVLATKQRKIINTRLLLSFSGAFLLALTLFELLPEVYHHLDTKETGLFIMIGILIQVTLEFFSKGAEHGHVHHHDQQHFPWAIFISLCIHSFLEGFPIHHHNDMVYGILVHKIPIAAVVTGFLLNAGCRKLHMAIFLIVFAIMTPLGTLISNHADYVSDYINLVNAIVIGIFLHISTTILFESSEGHKFNLTKLLTIILGVAIAYFM